MASADLLLHPVRLVVVQAFLGDRALTTDSSPPNWATYPPGSLYRHVAMLTKAGVLQVVAERRVRAVVERTYMLRILAAQIQPDEVAEMTPEQHLQAFVAYVAGMLTARRALPDDRHSRPGPRRRQLPDGRLWLTDAEFGDLIRDLQTIFQPRLANAPGKGRRRRMIYTVLLPAPEDTGHDRRAAAAKPRPQDKEGS